MMSPAASQRSEIGGPFTLTADDGRIVTERSFPGKYLAIYFGYTHCPDICPATLTNLVAALARLGPKATLVQPIFITVDPARDTRATLRQFTGNFSPGILGLTGAPGAIDAVCREYRVVRVSHASPGQHVNYVVDHSSVIYLMGPDGAFIAPIPADASEMVMAEALARYVKD